MSNKKIQHTDYTDNQYSLFYESSPSYNIEETSTSFRDFQTFEQPYIPIVFQTEKLTREDVLNNKLCTSLKDYSKEEGERTLVVYSIKNGIFLDNKLYLRKTYDDVKDFTIPFFKSVSKEEICTENFRAIAVKYIKKSIANIKQKIPVDFVLMKQIVQNKQCNDLFVLPTPKRKSFQLLSKKHRLDIMSPLYIELQSLKHLKSSKKIKTEPCSLNSEAESSMSAQSLKSANNETCVTQKNIKYQSSGILEGEKLFPQNIKLLNKNLGLKKEKFCYSDESDLSCNWNKQQSNASSALSKTTEINKSLSEVKCSFSSPSSLDMSGQVFSNSNSYNATVQKNLDKDNCHAKKLHPEIPKIFNFSNELNLTENCNTTFRNVDLLRQNTSCNSIDESIEKVIQDSNSSDSTCLKKNKKSERSSTMNNVKSFESLNSLAKTLCNKTCVIKLKDLKYSLPISAENSINLNNISDPQSLNFINAVKTNEKILEESKFLSDETETQKSIQSCNEQNNKKSKLIKNQKKNLFKHFSQNENVKQLKSKYSNVSPKKNVEYIKESSCSVKKHANLNPKKKKKDFSKESTNIAVQKNSIINSQQKVKPLRKRCAKNIRYGDTVKSANVSRRQQNGVKESVILNNIKKNLGNRYKARFIQPNRKNDELINSSKRNHSGFQNIKLRKDACSNVRIKSIESQQLTMNLNQEKKIINMPEKDFPTEIKKMEIPNLESVCKTAVANATAENIFIYAFPCCNCSHIPTNANSESSPMPKLIQVQGNVSFINDMHKFCFQNAK